ncbi:MAG: hypothetical protein ACOY82_05110 [Pseudomonadota bacterium]
MSVSTKPPLWFWIVGVLMLLWNAMGVMAYVQDATLTPEALQAMPEAERALRLARPAWATAAFAVAVFGGAVGCLLLLLRTRRALPVLVLSLIGVVVQMTHAFLIADSIAVYGPGGLIMPAMVLAFSLLLVWFAHRAGRRGWLR